MKIVELFSGIGGFKLGFENIGLRCIFSTDFDKYCKETFDFNFNEKLHLEDIMTLKSEIIPKFDILTAGFPCQPFSILGSRKGFSDNRGSLFFEIIRILKDKKPKCFLLENVKNLETHDSGKTLKIIYNELTKAGYYITHKVLNSMEYGNIPQNRERIFIVGFSNKKKFKKFKFPEKIPLTKTINECLEKIIDDKYYYNNKPLYNKIKEFVTDKNKIYQYRRTYIRENKKNVCPTLTANMGCGGHNVPIIKDSIGIRKLTPIECAKFQGFPEYYKFPGISDCQLYKQIGNSVTIPVILRIAENIKMVLN